MAQPPCQTVFEFEERVRAIVDPVALPSVAYGIARGAETLLLGAAGLADKETNAEATPQTPYSLASVTKPMTATAVMLLAERGLIRLDAPMNDYLGRAKLEAKLGDAQDATVWRVADHTAGLPLHFQFYYADEPYARPPMDETIRRYGKLFTPPGERYHYSNLGYGLLDYAIERLSGRSYAEFMAEEIFAPLGMRHATIGPSEGAAVPYGPDGVGYPHYGFDHPGGSAAFASVEDLLAFGRFHLGSGSSILPRERVLEMQRRTAVIDEHQGYGFGWGIHEDRLGFKLVRHTGSMGGVTTFLRLVPELDLVVAVVANGQGDLGTLGDEAVAAVSPEFCERLAAERDQPAEPVALEPVPDSLRGVWHGAIETYERTIPVRVDAQPGEKPNVVIEGRKKQLDEIQMRQGHLLGVFEADLGTPDAGRRPYRVHLDLVPRGERLNGAAVTITHVSGKGGGARGQRMGNALAYWVELAKEA